MKKKARQPHTCHRWLILGMFFFLSLVRGGLAFIGTHFKDQVDLITDFPASSEVYDRNGNLLYEFFGSIRRIPVDDSQIPQHLVFATLMAEDERFFSHPGFDPLGIARAFWKNMLADGIVEGGSTLGQQLVKNTILGPSDGYGDKLEEIFLSTAVDLKYSKQAILHIYLNTIPYGSNVYGVEAASRLYFGKHVSELSIAESAVLASLPKHPTFLSPFGEHTDELRNRRDWVLEKMFDGGYISEIEYSTAISTPLAFTDGEMHLLAPHFVLNLREELEEVLGKDQVENGGLLITTTLDLSLQKKAEDAVLAGQGLRERYRADSTGLLAMDPKTGEILAMVGNVNYFDEEDAGNVNMTTSLRQPGSSFKPLVYAALLDRQAYTPASVLWDVRKDFSIGDDPYIPRNYDSRYRGPVTIRNALAMSLNVPAVEALMHVGIDTALDFAEDMGISSLHKRDRFGPSLVLGGAEVTLKDLVNAYAVFANQGAYIPAQSILDIRTKDHKSVEWRTVSQRQVMHEETAYQITSMLSDNDARTPVFGRKSPLAFEDKMIAAKTGTTQEYRDAWTVGYTPELAVGVWVGNHQNQSMRYGAAGSVVAGPIWRDFMDAYLADHEPQPFELPRYLEEMKIYTALGVKEDLAAPWQIDAHQQAIAQRSYIRRSQKHAEAQENL